ncbi:MAG: TolC family protein [Salinivirgaceae bacterium]|nr:TolC family protein [Salinivirgaceae bacterium]
MKKLTLYIFLLFITPNIADAQEYNIEDSSKLIIPPLVDVLSAALIHSPLLEAKSIETKIIEQELKVEKKKWMDNVSIDGVANYGLFDQVVINGTNFDGISNTGFISKSEQIRYYAGVSLKLPISTLSSRRHKVNIKKLEIERLGYEKKQLQRELKQIIIEEYYMLLYLEESMRIFQEIFQSFQISYLKGEKDVLNNNIDLNDYAELASKLGKSENDYVKAKFAFYAQFHKLQDLSGVIFGIR